MQNIIPVFITEFNQESVNCINARLLHEFLDVKSKFADWVQNRIKKYGFVENIDYISLSKILENGGKSTEYYITLDMAKQLSMVENNAKGQQARLYFIQKEKEANSQMLALPQNYIQALETLLITKKTVLELENKVEKQGDKIVKLIEDKKTLQETIKDFFNGAELFTRTQAIRFLGSKGVKVAHKDITELLNRKKWIGLSDRGKYVATAKACKTGLFINEITSRKTIKRTRTDERGKFTIEGLTYIYNYFKKNQKNS